MKKLPNKTLAQYLVRKAIQDGKLTRTSCKECGELKTEAHHTDYSKPLEVIFLCRKHHKKWHKENGFPVGVNNFERVAISRGARQELKVQAYMLGQTMSEYLESLITREKNKRILKK